MPNMSVEEARKVEREPIKVGDEREFYCEMQQEYEPPEERLRRFTGQKVTVVRELDVDEGSSRAFTVRAADGTEFSAHEEELNGWDRDLGQFFWPDATFGPDHDTKFLGNEKE